MQHWYALYTKPKKERQVRSLLSSRGVDVYLPLLRVFKKGRLVVTSEPVFPCYLFAYLDLNDVGLSAVSYTQGLRSVVSFCGEPAVVDEGVIACIQKRLADSSGSDVYDRYRRGERVVVTQGPFRNLEAVFDGHLSASGRVRVLLSVLGAATPCEVDMSWLKKAA